VHREQDHRAQQSQALWSGLLVDQSIPGRDLLAKKSLDALSLRRTGTACPGAVMYRGSSGLILYNTVRKTRDRPQAVPCKLQDGVGGHVKPVWVHSDPTSLSPGVQLVLEAPLLPSAAHSLASTMVVSSSATAAHPARGLRAELLSPAQRSLGPPTTTALISTPCPQSHFLSADL